MPIIRLKEPTMRKAWRVLLATGEPFHGIPPAGERRYIISQMQLRKLQELQLDFDILEDQKGTVDAPVCS